MPYYDFSSQRPRQKKSRRLLLALAIAIAAAITAAVLLADHQQQPTQVTHKKTKSTHLTLPSKPLHLPPQTHAPKTMEKLSANTTPPPLEFYETLKSSNTTHT